MVLKRTKRFLRDWMLFTGMGKSQKNIFVTEISRIPFSPI